MIKTFPNLDEKFHFDCIFLYTNPLEGLDQENYMLYKGHENPKK